MESQEDWDEILDSVLFSIRISRHASTGISPFRMLYNKDPVLPFQYKDRLEQSPDAEPRDCLHLPDKGINDPIMEMVDMLEGNRNEIFEKACKNISKAQKVQARNYNKRNSAPGRRPLGINDKCLKKNMKAKSRKEKMLPKFTGPYLITGQTQGGFLLRNKYAHQLKRSVPASQLVRYYGVMPVEDEECVGADSDASDSGSEKELHQSCQRSSGLVKENKQKGPEKKENTPIGGQIVIMATNDKGFSSSDESLIDVVTNGKISNPFGNIDVNEIPIEIVEDLYSDNSDADDELEVDEEIRFKSREKKRKCMPEQNMFDHNTLITSDHSDADEEIEVEIQKSTNLNSAVKFLPLDSEQRANAAHKMCVRLPKNTNSLQNRGVGMIFASEPVISIEAKPDGACLFNTISLLLTGSEVYSYMFRHAICNYIANPANLGKMRQHIPLMYSSGEEYIQKSRRRDPYSWGTDCEIFACSIMTGYDVMVYSNQRKWLIYSKIGKGERTTENAMYINNIQGNHFDPIFSAIDY